MKNRMLLMGRTLLLLTVLYIFSGCAKQHVDGQNGKNSDEVTFTIITPGSSMSSTRAIVEGSDKDNWIETLDILLFDESDKYLRSFYYDNFTTAQQSNIRDIKIKLPKGKYYFVLLANVHEQFVNSAPGVGTESRAQVLAKLNESLSTGEKWNSDPASGAYKHLPMWGQSNAWEELPKTGATPEDRKVKITMLRMMAKVNVIAPTGFTLTSVDVYNYNTKGYVAGDPAKWAANPRLATEYAGTRDATKTPVQYGSSFITNGVDGSLNPITQCVDEIFLFESVKGVASGGIYTNVCIVIGGTYNGQSSYYRIDFEQGGNYMEIVRNHKYQINIQAINSSSWSSSIEAYENEPKGLEVSIVAWNEFGWDNMQFDGDRFLKVIIDNKFVFARDQVTAADEENKFTVETNVTTGWKIEKIVDTNGENIYDNATASKNWLEADIMSWATANQEKTLTLLLAQNNGAERKGYIHLAAGMMTKIIEVTQSNKPAVTMMVTQAGESIEKLIFAAAKGVQPAAQSFDVNWKPITNQATVNIAAKSGYSAFVFAGGSDNIVNGTLSGGNKSYSIFPPALTDADMGGNAFFERQSEVTFTTTYNSEIKSKKLLLHQYVPTIVPTVEAFYIADGSTYSFNVKSNRPWRAFLTNAGNQQGKGNMITAPAVSTTLSFATGGYNLPGGTDVGFTTFNDLTNPTIFSGTGKVRIEWLSGTDESNSAHWTTTDIDLNCASGKIQPESNSYIVAPGGAGILIPVTRANESMLGTQLGANEVFTAELVWTDNANRIAANSNIKMISAAGSGTGGYVLVIPGSVRGNAVVAIRNAANKILWSWHIWVTGYNPTPVGTGQFMDRNLGAFSDTSTATVTDISATGLMYQWGRKDPFPGSTTLDGTTEPTLYMAAGTTIVIKAPVAVASNFANSVANPTTFYYNTTNPYDWYSNGATQNDALWIPASKTVYDPCPDGWRVPQIGVWATLTTTNFPWGDYGRTAATHGGFYPAAGFRNQNNGALSSVGKIGHYWSTKVEGLYGNDFGFNTSVYPSTIGHRASSYSVRCVQE